MCYLVMFWICFRVREKVKNAVDKSPIRQGLVVYDDSIIKDNAVAGEYDSHDLMSYFCFLWRWD